MSSSARATFSPSTMILKFCAVLFSIFDANVPSLTLDPNLPAGAVGAGQQGEFFRLVHGVVCARHHNLISRLPALLYFILQVQHHLVRSVHLEARDGETWGTAII